MKKPTTPPETDISDSDLLKRSLNQTEEGHVDFSITLLTSLPYPAMYVRQKDRVIIAANKLATDLGAKIGDHCWREFTKTEFITEEEKEIAAKHPNIVPEELNIKCSFCLGAECITANPCQNNPEVRAFGRIWDTYWIKVSNDVFLHYLIDITSRKELEESLRENASFLKQTQQIAMLGTYNLNISTGEWDSSEVLDTIFGIKPKPKKTIEEWLSCIHPDMQTMMLDYFIKEVVENKTKFDKEYKIIRQNDGAVRWVHGIGNLNFDSNGQPIRMIGTIRDITDRKQEQSRIIRNLKFTEVLLKSIPIPVFFKDANGLYTGCNEAFTRQMGITSDEINGKSVMELWPSDQAETYHQMDLDLMITQEFQSYESQITDKRKRVRDVIFAKNVFYDEVGHVAGIVGTYLDITEQKQTENALRKSEQKYKLLSKNISDGIFTCRNGYIEYANRSMSRIFGCDEADLEGMELALLIVPERRDEFRKSISSEPEIHIPSSIETECITKENSTIFVEMFLNYVSTERLIYGVIHDVTEKRQMQKKSIVKAIIQTEERERAYFSKELHDGLGPLLSTIKLYLQWSMRPKTKKSRKEIILKAEEVLEEALIAVKEISNKLSPHLLTNYGLTSAVQSFVNKLRETNTIKINFVSNVTRRVEIEIEVALYRAIIECVNNTIKYAKAGHIYITLHDADNQILLMYRDDGKGFDIVKILLEKKGLGLFNLQNRIQTIGGKIQMFSKPREGVNYQISIPLK